MRQFLYIALILLCTAACAKEPKVSNLPETQNEALMSPDTLLAQFVGYAQEGATKSFQSTRFGDVTVTAGRSYHSALNIECREAYIRGASRTKASVCKDEKYGWIIAPDILGEGVYR